MDKAFIQDPMARRLFDGGPVVIEPRAVVIIDPPYRSAIMTESEWLASTDAAAMMRHLDDGKTRHPLATPRKLRLFAVACCRLVWDRLTDDAPCRECTDASGVYGRMDHYTGKITWHPCKFCDATGRVNRSRQAVLVAERFADGEATEKELGAAREAAHHAWNDYPLFNPIGLARYTCLPDIIHAVQTITRPDLTEVAPPATQADLLRCIFGNPFRPPPDPRWQANDGGKSRAPAVATWLTPTVLALARRAYAERDWSALPVLADALEEASCADGAILSHLRGPGPHARGCWLVDLILGKS